jgi:hypothetical protein
MIINYYNNINNRSNDEYNKNNDDNNFLRNFYIPEFDKDSTNIERFAKIVISINERLRAGNNINKNSIFFNFFGNKFLRNCRRTDYSGK